MLDSFVYSVEVILPIFILAALGILLRKLDLIEETFTRSADRLVFRVALPAMVFLEVSGSELSDALSPELAAFTIGAITATFVCATVVIVLVVRDNGKRGAMIQGICRSNFAILGVALLQNMFGDEGVAAVALVLPITVLLFGTYSVIILSIFAPADKKMTAGQALKKILIGVLTNPLIIAVVIALPFMLFRIPVVSVASKTLNYLKALVTPVSLISLGASFRPEGFRGRIGHAVCAAISKTVLLPLAAVTAAVLLGFRGVSLGIVLILFGAPTAVSSYVMARNMGSDGELAGQILLLTTMICLFTIFLGIFILRAFALI